LNKAKEKAKAEERVEGAERSKEVPFRGFRGRGVKKKSPSEDLGAEGAQCPLLSLKFRVGIQPPP